MESQSKILWGAVAVIIVLLLALILQPRIQEQLAPEPRGAWVAFEVDDSGLAIVEPIDISAEQSFRLHAVLEAVDRDDQVLYYTQAKRLRIHGEEVPAERLLPWDRPRPVRVRWLTLEGSRRFIELEQNAPTGQFEIKPFLRTTWPIGWSIPGELEPANDDHLAIEQIVPITFGTQRYQVQIEFYETEQSVVPQQTLYSWGVDELRQRSAEFPTVRKTLPGLLERPSRVFGLIQLEQPPDADAEMLRKIDELAELGIAFSRLTLLHDQIRAAGKRLQDIKWETIDLSGSWGWEEAIRGGDLLRAGERIVILYLDRGESGVFDGADLCFDFIQGVEIRRLDEVFSSDSALEWGSLHKTYSQ